MTTAELEIPREADLALLVDARSVRLFRPSVIGGDEVEPIVVAAPASLLLTLAARRQADGLDAEARRELATWITGSRRLEDAWRREVSRSPLGGVGALLYCRVRSPLLDEDLGTWWVCVRGAIFPVPDWITPGVRLRSFQAVIRLQHGWRQAAAVGLATAAIVGLAFMVARPLQAMDDAAYALSLLLVPRPELSPNVEVLFLPTIHNANERTDRALLAEVTTTALDLGAAAVGLDTWLDQEGDPQGAIQLSEVIANNRDRVILIEYPLAAAQNQIERLIVDRFRAAICPDEKSPCSSSEDGSGPVAYGGFFDRNPGHHLNRVALRYDERRVQSRVRDPARSTQSRWGTDVLTQLGAQTFRVWCRGLAVADDGVACWDLPERWEPALRLRFPRQPSLLRLDKSARNSDEIKTWLRQHGVDLAGRVLLVSSWDAQEDAHDLPVLDELGDGFGPGQWPGLLVHAAVFHTLAERDPIFDLRDRVDWLASAGGTVAADDRPASGALAVWLWLVFWGLLAAFGARLGGRGILLVPALIGLEVLVGVAGLRGLSLWLPVPATAITIIFCWGLVTLRRS